MDPLDVARSLPVDAGWMMVALLLAYSAYKLTPSVARRYDVQTRLLTDKDAHNATEIMRKLNGRVYADIERHLIASATFRERYVPMHRLNAVEGEQQRILAEISEHIREDREMHERIRANEVRVTEIEKDVREIKEDLRLAARSITEEAKSIRREQGEGERRIVEHIDRLFERRTLPRS